MDKDQTNESPTEDLDNEYELPFLPMGSLVRARLEFKHIETRESMITSPHPVVVLCDSGDGNVQIATLTSRIEKQHVAMCMVMYLKIHWNMDFPKNQQFFVQTLIEGTYLEKNFLNHSVEFLFQK